MNVLKLLLYPFAAIYNGVMRFRNHLYDIGQKPSFEFETTVISVGNLNVGGSGKTPMVEYLIQLLADRFPTVTLSRGYKRDTKGYRLAGSKDTARTVGDEPFQIYSKFGSRVHVVVGEDRVYAIPNILHELPDTRVLVLDDALQQRSIRPNLMIMLTTHERPFFNDYLLPFGRLRESRSGARRADIIVVTKCPDDLTEAQQRETENRIRRYAPTSHIFFAAIRYGNPVAARPGRSIAEAIVLVTGIANAEPLRKYCAERFKLLKHFSFADHHHFSQADLGAVEDYCQRQGAAVSLITTEKDLMRLDCADYAPFLDRLSWFSIPIRLEFLRDGAKFEALVLDSVERIKQ